MTASAETIPLLVTLGHPGDNSFNLRFPLVHRHDGKRFVLKRGGSEIEAVGYSEKETEQFLQKMQAEQAERDAATRRVLGRTLEEDD